MLGARLKNNHRDIKISKNMAINTIHFKERLLNEEVNLKSELSDIASYSEVTNSWEAMPEEQNGPEADPNDLADRGEGYEKRSETVKTLSKRLDDIQIALGKIEKGSYGICEATGEQIETDRLEANPAARTNKAHMND